jgi:hypothetical protein
VAHTYAAIVAGPCLRRQRNTPARTRLGFIPVLPPLFTRVSLWEYDRQIYKRRNEVERLFRRLKGFRRIFLRFDKLDRMFAGFISFALVADGLRLC